MFNGVFPQCPAQNGATPYNQWRWNLYEVWKDSEDDKHVAGECSGIDQKRLGCPSLQAARKQQEADVTPICKPQDTCETRNNARRRSKGTFSMAEYIVRIERRLTYIVLVATSPNHKSQSSFFMDASWFLAVKSLAAGK
jgi:hypothetical protein